MPSLKNLSCQIQWADTSTPFQEYGIVYGDGIVECYIAVPDKPQPFNIRLTSNGFIYEGLAVAIFMDGTYQCNRNRVNLIPAKKGIPREKTEIDFVMRQKEKPMGDGLYMGRQWRFDNHNIVPDPPKKPEKSHFEDLGIIEVLVMRCRAKDSDDTDASTVTSAAESGIINDSPDVGGNDSTDEEESSKGDKPVENSRVESVAAADEGDGMMSSLFGIFDGAADYHCGATYDARRPPRPPDYGYHHWHHGEHSPHYLPHHDACSQRYRDGYQSQIPYPPPPPHRGAPPKRVHFDHGPPRHNSQPQPPDWADHYSDRFAHDQNGGLHHPAPQGYTPGLSEYQFGPHYPIGDPPFTVLHGYPPPPVPTGPSSRGNQNWSHPHHITRFPPHTVPPFLGAAAHSYPTYPPPYYPAHHFAWQVAPNQQPPDGQDTHIFAGQRNSSSSGLSPKPHQQTKPGSLDPARGENNSQDGWDQTGAGGADDWNNQDGNNKNGSNDDVNQPNGGGGAGAWDSGDGGRGGGTWDPGNGGDDNNWDSSGGGNGDNSWQNTNGNNPDGNQSGGGDNNDSSNQNCWSGDVQNNSWQSGSNKPQSGGDQGWGNDENPSNNTAPNTTPAPANNEWSGQPVDSTAAPATVISLGARVLYGPHGPYYAFESEAAVDAPCDAEEEPRYDVLQSFAEEFGSKKQVQPGKGYLYTKKRCAPEYIDDMKEPYARFVFKYRTKEELKKEINIELDAEPSGNEEVQKFQTFSKDDLINMLLRAQGALGGKIPSPPPQEFGSPGTKAADPFEPVVIEPPDVSHLEYNLPEHWSTVSGGGNKSANDGWTQAPAATATPGAWPDANPGEQKQGWGDGKASSTANKDTGGDSWGNADFNHSMKPEPLWDQTKHADSCQTPQIRSGSGNDTKQKQNGRQQAAAPKHGW